MTHRHESIVWVGEQKTEAHGYTVRFEPEAFGGYTAHFPAIPALKPYGETYNEACARAAEGLALHLERLEKRGEPVPKGNAATGSEREIMTLRSLAALKRTRKSGP